MTREAEENPESNPPHLSLKVGELIVSDRPFVVSTVLGSCVSVCLYSPSKGVGGIIHYALPHELRALESEEDYLRYGAHAIPLLIGRAQALIGGGRAPLLAKLVGGAAVCSSTVDIGGGNVKLARELLQEFGIPLMGEDVGGILGRRLQFHSGSGRLQVTTILPATG
jgi:chemotaxis protein CheD